MVVKASWVWKAVGLAGVAGVAATGAVIVRSERRRRTTSPEEVRARLHARLAAADDTVQPVETPGRTRALVHRLREWFRARR